MTPSTPRVMDDLNRRFPPHAQVDFLNRKTETAVPVFYEYRNLKILRADIILRADRIRTSRTSGF